MRAPNMRKVLWLIAILLLLAVIATLLSGCVTPWGRAVVNEWDYHIQKADDATRYETRRKVEDACRAMIASYTSDAMTYKQYRDSDNEEKQTWAEQARMRANKTAASYNEYILKNSFVWEGNIPQDIKESLPYL